MPWSVKAQELLVDQYAPVGVAANVALGAALEAVALVSRRGIDVHELDLHLQRRIAAARRYVDAYGRYCWPVEGVSDLRLAPFQVLASEGAVHIDKTHLWHMQQAAVLAEAGGPTIAATPHRVVDLDDGASVAEAIAWWAGITETGGEGVVVKPVDPLPRGDSTGRHVQPGIKCRGPEYLRVIYGPEYDLPANLERLRDRGTLAVKRSLASREFALGIEALGRFVAREPLYRIHECVFGVLALESEPVDPAL
jgi:protein phosphatase